MASERKPLASGKLVFPGFIDPHVTFICLSGDLLRRDTPAKRAASRLYLVEPLPTLKCAVRNRNDDASCRVTNSGSRRRTGRSAGDLHFHMSVNKIVKEKPAKLRQVVADGWTSSFKISFRTKNFFGGRRGKCYQTMRLARKLGVMSRPLRRTRSSWPNCQRKTAERRKERLVQSGMNRAGRKSVDRAEGGTRGDFRRFLENTKATGSWWCICP